MKHWAFITTVLIGQAWPAQRAAADTLNLAFEDLPRLVAENNRNVRAVRQAAEAARGRTGFAQRSFLPHLAAEAGQETFKTGVYDQRSQPYGGVEASLNLFRGGRDSLEENVREGQAKLAETLAKKLQIEELAKARKIYWRLAMNGELIASLEDAKARNEKVLESAQRRINRGLTTDTDRLEFEMYGLELQEEIESLTHEMLLLELELAPVLGQLEGTRFATVKAIPHQHDDELLSQEPQPGNMPDVATAREQASLAKFQGSLAARGWTPALDIYAGHHLYTFREREYVLQSERDDQVAGIRLKMALFDGLEPRAAARAFRKQSEAYRNQADHQSETVRARVRIAQEDMKHEDELIHSSERRIELGKKYLALTLDEYDRGVKNSPDVLGALQKWVNLNREYAERRREYQAVRAELLQLLGQ